MNSYYTETLYPLQDKDLATIDTLDTPLYLTGGTALSRGYFSHRYSDDLDLFLNNDPLFSTYTQRVLDALRRPYSVQVRLHGIFSIGYRQ